MSIDVEAVVRKSMGGAECWSIRVSCERFVVDSQPDRGFFIPRLLLLWSASFGHDATCLAEDRGALLLELFKKALRGRASQDMGVVLGRGLNILFLWR